MGLCAEVIAVGPFSDNIVDVLEYPNGYHRIVKPGAIITESLFVIYEGSTVSRERARLLGISDVWDFNQHKIDNENINEAGLREFVIDFEDDAHDLAVFMTLKRNSFEFHFRPNG